MANSGSGVNEGLQDAAEASEATVASSMIVMIAYEQHAIRDITEAIAETTCRRGNGIMVHTCCYGDKGRQ
eukprot:401816-Pyramimonas_sp.AAC.2